MAPLFIDSMPNFSTPALEGVLCDGWNAGRCDKVDAHVSQAVEHEVRQLNRGRGTRLGVVCSRCAVPSHAAFNRFLGNVFFVIKSEINPVMSAVILTVQISAWRAWSLIETDRPCRVVGEK